MARKQQLSLAVGEFAIRRVNEPAGCRRLNSKAEGAALHDGRAGKAIRALIAEHFGGFPLIKLITVVAASMLATALPVYAADAPAKTTTTAAAPAATPSPAQQAQQDKMKSCNVKAEGKTGDDRKKFMSDCLSAKPAEPAKPESKMAMCNKQTAGLSGEARNKAQSECMKGPAK
jgi:hypothetical protein